MSMWSREERIEFGVRDIKEKTNILEQRLDSIETKIDKIIGILTKEDGSKGIKDLSDIVDASQLPPTLTSLRDHKKKITAEEFIEELRKLPL